MIVVKTQGALRPAELMERVVLYVLNRFGALEVKRLSRDSERDHVTRFVVSLGSASADTIQIEAHAATLERGKQLGASVALFGVGTAISTLQREIADQLADWYDGFVWEPDPRETQRLRLPALDALRDRRRGIRHAVADVAAQVDDTIQEIRDLSHGGVSFLAQRPHEAGSLLPIALTLPDGQIVALLLRIRWQTQAQTSGLYPTGGQIVAIQERDRLLLESYLDSV